MQKNIIIAGVGGQGILSVAFVLCNAALKEKLNFKQAEVHGMAQRGGAVQSNLRISDQPIASDLIPLGQCDLILAVEPLEALRYTQYLKPEGTIVTSINSFVNIPNYPDAESLWKEFERVPTTIPLDAMTLAKNAGSSLAQGMVVLGAASLYLPMKLESFEEWVTNLWKPKGEKVVETNLNAFRSGRKVAEFLKNVQEKGASLEALRALTTSITLEAAIPEKAEEWVTLLNNTPTEKWSETIPAHL